MFIDLINSDKKALIDDADVELVKGYSFRLTKGGYVSVSICNKEEKKSKEILLHRIVTGCASDLVVDHINHNPLDNRKINLRICTKAENLANRKMSKSNKLKVRGVRFEQDHHHYNKPFCARVTKDGVTYRSWHASIENASAWIKQKSIELHGEFACLDGCLGHSDGHASI